MIIYAIIMHVPYEYDEVWGLYDTKPLAEDAIEVLEKYRDGGNTLQIQEFELNKSIFDK